MHEFIAIRHSLVKPPKIKITGPNSFSLIFREQDHEELSFSVPVSVIIGFDSLNNLIYLSIEILSKIYVNKSKDFYSFLYTLVKDGVEVNFPYIYMYFKDYKEVPDYYDFPADATFFIDKQGIKRIDFVVDKNYEELEYLMRRIASVP